MKNPEDIQEIYILNEKLDLLCSIAEFNKLEWTEKLYEADSFSIEMDFERIKDTRSNEYTYYKEIYDALVKSTKNGYYPRYIITDADKGLTRIGYIENYNFNDDGTLEIKGEGFLKFLEKRYCIEKDYIPTSANRDECGRVMCRIINDNNKPEQTHYTPFLIANENENAFGEEIFVSCERKDYLYKKLNTLAEAYQVGMATLCDPFEKKIYFKAFQYKKDKIKTVLSEDDDNIISLSYETDTGKYYNYALIEGDGLNAIVDLRKDKGKEPALELYKKSSKKKGSYSTKDYQGLLEAEGKEALASKKTEEKFDIEPTQDIKVNIGEYVLCKIDLGYEEFYKELPVTEIKHTIDKGNYNKEVLFGDVFNLSNELKQSLGVN